MPATAPLVRYVAVSSGIPFTTGTQSYAVGTAQYNWTSAAIDGARAAGIPWVVVGNHTPCLSLGEYACEMGSDLANLLLAKKVDLVLNGHEHIYQRTKQLTTRAGCTTLVPGTFNASCVVDSDNSLAAGAGTVFATVGTGGINQRNVNTADPEAGYFAAYAGANVNSDLRRARLLRHGRRADGGLPAGLGRHVHRLLHHHARGTTGQPAAGGRLHADLHPAGLHRERLGQRRPGWHHRLLRVAVRGRQHRHRRHVEPHVCRGRHLHDHPHRDRRRRRHRHDHALR